MLALPTTIGIAGCVINVVEAPDQGDTLAALSNPSTAVPWNLITSASDHCIEIAFARKSPHLGKPKPEAFRVYWPIGRLLLFAGIRHERNDTLTA